MLISLNCFWRRYCSSACFH